MFSKILDKEAFEKARALCRGAYQENLLIGIEALSGSTLRGKARRYSAQYKRSAQSLLRRMTEAGIPWREERGPHGKRILVIGEDS